MRKLINLSAFVLAILIIVFMLIPTKTVDRNASVYVEHEWDTLENVILGSPKMLAVPQIHKSVLGYGYIVKNEKMTHIKDKIFFVFILVSLSFY